eukprot:270022-Chlamydomonas_euryale.AAC.1
MAQPLMPIPCRSIPSCASVHPLPCSRLSSAAECAMRWSAVIGSREHPVSSTALESPTLAIVTRPCARCSSTAVTVVPSGRLA